ncbi:MAG: hypothetical protein V8R64_03160 [Thomasclavelia sp.]
MKADKKLIGTLNSTIDDQTLVSTIEIEYDSDDNAVAKGTFKTKYDNLEKTQTNNNILTKSIDHQTKIEQLEGVEVTANATDISFDFEEIWDYNIVDTKAAMEADDEQKNFIENNKYSLEKIKAYYEKKGYSFKEKNLK